MAGLRELLAPIVVAVATLAAIPLAGCAPSTPSTPTIVVRDAAPPAERVERAEYRRGYVFIGGHWTHGSDRSWAWIPGHYERARPGHVYIEGRWRPDRDGYVWIDGEWRRRSGVATREPR